MWKAMAKDQLKSHSSGHFNWTLWAIIHMHRIFNPVTQFSTSPLWIRVKNFSNGKHK